MSRLSVSNGNIEVDKPSGGGKGPDTLYHITLSIDGVPALFLTRPDFKQTGQMHAFLEIIEKLIALDS